jgi:hypothetical protein
MYTVLSDDSVNGPANLGGVAGVISVSKFIPFELFKNPVPYCNLFIKISSAVCTVMQAGRGDPFQVNFKICGTLPREKCNPAAFFYATGKSATRMQGNELRQRIPTLPPIGVSNAWDLVEIPIMESLASVSTSTIGPPPHNATSLPILSVYGSREAVTVPASPNCTKLAPSCIGPIRF